MITPSRVISQARLWIGTPYHDQACIRGIGCDCVGLFIGLGRELGVAVISVTDYCAEPTGAELLGYLETNCIRLPIETLAETQPGMFIAMNMRASPGPHHIALRTETGLIHAFGGKVREEPLFGRQRFHSAWKHKEISSWRSSPS